METVERVLALFDYDLEFPAYLQGMETNTSCFSFSATHSFPAYLQGMETTKAGARVLSFMKVPSLPTRNGNLTRRVQSHQFPDVPSLPTRNGNGSRWPSTTRRAACSQPTYKEWKRAYKAVKRALERLFPAYLQGMETVLSVLSLLLVRVVPSLPTRNGNAEVHHLVAGCVLVPSLPTRNGNDGSYPGGVIPWAFPAYLQGMETAVCRERPALPFQVPSLPTRNGNARRRGDHRCVRTQFPAYLQGMETTCGSTPSVRASWFPAYLQGMETFPGIQEGVIVARSQPTYKEWKHAQPELCRHQSAVFPAYLQGMETISVARRTLHGGKFPAYLQGMETELLESLLRAIR